MSGCDGGDYPSAKCAVVALISSARLLVARASAYSAISARPSPPMYSPRLADLDDVGSQRLPLAQTIAGRRSITAWSQGIWQRLREPSPNAVPVLLLALIFPCYHAIVMFNRGRTMFTPELALDRTIPLQPAWMLAYGSIWVFAFLPAFVVRRPALMRRAIVAMLSVMVVAYLVFLLYPTALPRPESVGEGFLAGSLGVVYSLDPPQNCFPSLHVAWAFVAALTSYRVHRGVGLAALVWAAIISVSTLYTKQHYVVDVIGGIAIAHAAYLLFLRGYPRAAISQTHRTLAPKRALRAVWLYCGIVAFLWVYRSVVAS